MHAKAKPDIQGRRRELRTNLHKKLTSKDTKELRTVQRAEGNRLTVCTTDFGLQSTSQGSVKRRGPRLSTAPCGSARMLPLLDDRPAQNAPGPQRSVFVWQPCASRPQACQGGT